MLFSCLLWPKALGWAHFFGAVLVFLSPVVLQSKKSPPPAAKAAALSGGRHSGSGSLLAEASAEAGHAGKNASGSVAVEVVVQAAEP